MQIEQMQPKLIERLCREFTNQRLAHAYLFEGEAGTGKEMLAIWLAQLIFCQSVTDKGPCQKCNHCIRIKDNDFPDVHYVEAEGQTIKVADIRQLKSDFSQSGLEGQQQVFIIKSADKLTVSAANSLLKFLEEPISQSTAILVTDQKAQLLPTILSRCQVVHFSPLAPDVIKRTLLAEGFSPNQADFFSQYTNSIEMAKTLAEDEWFQTARKATNEWADYLLKRDYLAFIYVQQNLLKVFKEKEQQWQLFDILIMRYRKEMLKDSKQALRLVNDFEDILGAKKRYTNNVSFQNILEQLALNLLNNA